MSEKKVLASVAKMMDAETEIVVINDEGNELEIDSLRFWSGGTLEIRLKPQQGDLMKRRDSIMAEIAELQEQANDLERRIAEGEGQ